jgi:lysozyme
MVKEKAVKAVTKKKQPSKPVVKKRTPAKRKNKKKKQKEMPSWYKYLLGFLIVVVFSGVFYYFFIRPYAYRWKPCYGMKGYGVCMPHGYKVHGIDISHYQGDINWKMLEQTRQGQFPVQFIFMKATEGGDYSDKRFVANFDSAKAHGFIRGAYHFYNPKTDVNKQADFFINSVKLEPGDLPPVLDIEKKGKDMKKLQADLKLWLRRIENHYGVKPIIYASYKFKNRYLNDSVFNSYPYWIAHYYVDSVYYKGDWKFWQHTDVGTLPGIKEQVDLNVFNGGLEGLDALRIKEKGGK